MRPINYPDNLISHSENFIDYPDNLINYSGDPC